MTKGTESGEMSFDSDEVIYKIIGIPKAKVVLFGFKCSAAAEIMANGGQEMIDAMYAEYACPPEEGVPDFDVTLKISTSSIPKTKKIQNTMSEEEQEQIREGNEVIR